jgi:hypothetical protein
MMMKNKKVKQSLYSVYCFIHGKHVDAWDRERYEWAFDRLRLFEMGMSRKQLRHTHLSKASLTADQLRGK